MGEHTQIQLVPDSITERHYAIRDLDHPIDDAVLLRRGVDATEWALKQKQPPVERFASFTVLQGLIKMPGAVIPFTSERYDVSGYTYIDGRVCEPTVESIVEVLATGSEVTERDGAFAEYWLHRLKQTQSQGVERVVVGRSYATIHIFNEGTDHILRRRR